MATWRSIAGWHPTRSRRVRCAPDARSCPVSMAPLALALILFNCGTDERLQHDPYAGMEANGTAGAQPDDAAGAQPDDAAGAQPDGAAGAHGNGTAGGTGTAVLGSAGGPARFGAAPGAAGSADSADGGAGAAPPDAIHGPCQQASDCTHAIYDRPVASEADCYCPGCPDPTDQQTAILKTVHDDYQTQWADHCSLWDQECPLVPCPLPPPVVCSATGVCQLGSLDR
jgi:hypothetical protein